MIVMNKQRIVQIAKVAVFIAALTPFLGYLAALYSDALGANPIEAIQRASGDWAMRLLWATLAITPLRKLTGEPALLKFRRMLGLYAFFYASVHLIIYLWLDQFFSWPDIVADIIERPFITVGFFSFLILVPLAATSTRAMMRRLKRRWGKLHKSVYGAAIVAELHFWWMKASKSDVSEPLIYLLILALLLGFRFFPWLSGMLKRSGLTSGAMDMVRP